MRIIKTAAAMQAAARRWGRAGLRTGFVPTMGYLHEGHASLMRRARQAVGKAGRVVVSIYVNPTQFAPHEDLSKYPRDLERDKALCRKEGVDALFVPDDTQMYPEGSGGHSAYVVEDRLALRMEGASRPSHFRGVTTVVAKLFNLTLPTVSVFGAKDYQQAAVVQKMVRDLNFPVKIIVAPTRREADGLAMSSRNKYLSAGERPQASALWKSLELARNQVAAKPVAADQLRQVLSDFIHQQPAARVDYIEFFDPVTLEPSRNVSKSDRMALAVWIGKTRLIDNGSLE